MEDQEIKALPASIAARARQLDLLLSTVLPKQWQRPPVHHMDKAGGGPARLVSDPTADIALDIGRLKLRAQVLAVGRELAAADEKLGNLARQLHKALETYER